MIAAIAALLAWAQPAPTDFPTAPCAASEAVRVTVLEITGRPDRYYGRCVTVSGPYAGITMYSGREGLYRVNRYGADGHRAAADLRHRIGIDRQQLRDLELRHPLLTTVTGRVDNCGRRQARYEQGARMRGEVPLIMLTGYCHYYGGPSIVVHSFRISERTYERLVGETARREFGNLAPMPSDWPHRAAIEALTRDFLAALRARDRAALAALHDIRPDARDEDDRALFYWLLDFRDSPFAALRNAAPPQIAWFVGASAGGAPLPSDEDIAARVCFCRTADCTGRWPIASNDADADPARPYVCTAIEPRDWTPRRAGLNTPVPRAGWLREPAATAFRSAGNASAR